MINLGYACISEELSAQKPKIFTSRTCREATFREKGLDYVNTLIEKNLDDLQTIIQHNAKNRIFVFRMSSEMFPFASHPELGYSLNIWREKLEEIGRIAKKLDMRLTFHPSHYNYLGSKTAKTIDNTIRDLTIHAQCLDYLGLNGNSVMVMHIGGVYGSKTDTLSRWEQNFRKLKVNIQKRIVIENDECSYTLEDLLEISEKLLIPLVLDYHHEMLNPSKKPLEELLPKISAVWKKRNIRQKMHYSESRDPNGNFQEKRAHSYLIENLPEPQFLIKDSDLMLETKAKELSLYHIREKFKNDSKYNLLINFN